MKLKRVLASIALLSWSALGSFAQTPSVFEEAGTRAATFLSMESGSRAAGLAGAYTGAADDADGMFWNPASLSSVSGKQLAATHNMSFGGIAHSTIAYAQALSNGGSFGVSFQGVFGSIERRAGDTLEADSEFTPGEFAFGVGYSHRLGGLSLGATAKGVQQRFDVETNAGAAFDFGALYRFGRFSAGASLLSAGPPLGDSEGPTGLPTTFRVGGSAMIAEEGPLLAVDFVVPSDDFNSARIGIEHWFFDQIALRGGYHIVEGENPAEGFSAGIGLKSEGTAPLENTDFQLDYAFVPEDGIADAHRISLLMRF